MEIHRDIYRNIQFFKHKERSFIVWVGPLLRPYMISELDYIYKEGDHIKESNEFEALDFFYSLLYGQWTRRILFAKV